ncbi:hypothetical protein HNP37_004345 [Flavobacterium nitrogenifigens]|uniref:Uncharacterized protein n=2 Tax=Flavobacterium TaxID=237 RepID=A0A7W7N8W3_9FLAO|nr:hypothetical protein [Flavobacterium nitrogenifigens]MBB6389346.1 hypothetical protein [Flavobacterium notoginsengisoli]
MSLNILSTFAIPGHQTNQCKKQTTMKFNDSNNQDKGMNVIQKIGLCVLVLTIIVYYVLSIQFLTA